MFAAADRTRLARGTTTDDRPFHRRPGDIQRPVAHLRAKAAALLLFTLALIAGSALWPACARRVEPMRQLVLVADDSEGVAMAWT